MVTMKRMFGANHVKNSGTSEPMDKVVNDTITNITKAIKNDVFHTKKYILGPEGKVKLALKVLEVLNLEGFKGDSKEAQTNRQNWVELWQDTCVLTFNSIRNNVSTEEKKAARALYCRSQKQLPDDNDMEACITRQLDLDNNEHLVKFEWCSHEFMAKACGSAKHWNKEKREHMPLSRAHPKNSKKPYITPQTEAYAVLLFKGNHTC
jgi:ribosomal protein S8